MADAVLKEADRMQKMIVLRLCDSSNQAQTAGGGTLPVPYTYVFTDHIVMVGEARNGTCEIYIAGSGCYYVHPGDLHILETWIREL